MHAFCLKIVTAVFLGLISFGPSPMTVRAAGVPETLDVLIHFDADNATPHWVVAAYQKNLEQVLSRQQRLIVRYEHQTSLLKKCQSGQTSCFLNELKQHQIQVFILGKVKPKQITYDVYETWTQSLIHQGKMNFDGNKPAYMVIQHEIQSSIQPFIEAGGWLDQHRKSHGLNKSNPPEAVAALKNWMSLHMKWVEWICLALALIWLAIPIFTISFIRASSKYKNALIRPALVSHSILLIGFLILAIGGYAYDLLENNSTSLAQANPISELLNGKILSSYFQGAFNWQNIQWLLYFFGGLAWGWFFKICFRMIISPLYGIERVRHWNITQLLSSWTIVILIKSIFYLCVAIPFAASVWLYAQLFNIPSAMALIVITPFMGLLSLHWFRCIVTAIGVFLDEHLVLGITTTENPWHIHIKKYFLGYLKRRGISLPTKLIDSIHFLPGSGHQVASYLGGNQHPCIVVPERLVELAMGPLFEQKKSHEFPVRFDQAPMGLLSPNIDLKKIDKKQERRAQKLYDQLTPLSPEEAYFPAQAESQLKNPAYGIVLPDNIDHSIPLISNSLQDLDTVDELLTDHHAEYEVQRLEEELDDTDSNDKDFLFGLLFHHVGRIRRKDHWADNLHLIYRNRFFTGPEILQPIFMGLTVFYYKVFFKYNAIVADSFSALNFGLHHYIQYLDLIANNNSSHLTTRANQDQLHAESLKILRQLKSIDKIESVQRGDLLYRLTWLSQYFYNPIGVVARSPIRVFLTATLVITLSSWLMLSLWQAFDYHPKYTQWLATEHQRIAELKTKANQTP